MLGLIAAGGPFPLEVAQAARAAGQRVFVVCLRDFCDPALYASFPHVVERVGAAGAILDRLRAEGVRQLAIAGRARRPSLLSLWPDAWTARALARIGPAALGGDDAFLRALIRLVAAEGFEVIPPQSLIAGAMAPAGLLAGAQPDAMALGDVARGVGVLRALAAQDVGQAVVVQQGLVLGVEAVEGTDALIERCGALRRDGPGGVLVKLAKSGQEMRVDAPVIGPFTIAAAQQAGLRGIAVQAGRTILAERAESLRAAEAAGIFLLGLTPAETEGDTR
ncbi:MAG TPA: UDP-2,3-diacylglucosamine diphosphatase LpxI [Roseococcus sp.]|jgi:DUF1009 family protein|nr:UDP-2,3-diacylglucosamine diphosphatase LpxI [Roseococcus sp.]